MPLDLCLLNADDTLDAFVPVFLEQHGELMSVVAELPPGALLRRLHDYHGDAAFAPGEIGAFARELQILLPLLDGQPELFALVKSVLDLCRLAESRSLGLEAIAD